MNNCVSSQKLEIYGSEVIKAAEILMNGFCCDDVYQALILAADVLRESFQALAVACLQAERPRQAPIRNVFFSNAKHSKVRIVAFTNRRYVPP